MALAVSALLIVFGSLWCQLTVSLFEGKDDPCSGSPGGQPTCDRVMMLGEGLFYLAWPLSW